MREHPELWSAPAESIGREGMLTVWDDQGGYVGCMGTETWAAMCAVPVNAQQGDDGRWYPAAPLPEPRLWKLWRWLGLMR